MRATNEVLECVASECQREQKGTRRDPTCGASLKMSMLPLVYSALSCLVLSASRPAMENLRPCEIMHKSRIRPAFGNDSRDTRRANTTTVARSSFVMTAGS